MNVYDRCCPVCGCARQAPVHEANYDLAKLDRFAFAARKFPENMHFRMVRCRQCDVLYASPAPRAEEMIARYASAAFDSQLEAEQGARTYAAMLQKNIRHLPDKAAVLDIGTGDGAFLERLQEIGFARIVGIEPSLAPVRAAKDSIRPLIRSGAFCAADFSADSFSLVCCFQTLEHIANPGEMTRQVFSLLKPGGVFFCVAHNYRALLSVLMGRRSPIYDIEHLQLFSPQSGRQMLEASGFVDVRVAPVVNTYPLRYWLRLLPVPRAVTGRLLAMVNGVGLGRINVVLPVGNMSIWGRKPLSRTGSDSMIAGQN